MQLYAPWIAYSALETRRSADGEIERASRFQKQSIPSQAIPLPFWFHFQPPGVWDLGFDISIRITANQHPSPALTGS